MTENPVSVAQAAPPARSGVSRRRLLAPLALAQFICSFAGSNMNVMINDISRDLDTTVKGVQTTITLFLLIMAILMIPASKLTDRWGRKRCFIGGLTLYGIGALLSAVSPGLGRSEEHTSELQSPCNLVCRLLLEKNKRPAATVCCSCPHRASIASCSP